MNQSPHKLGATFHSSSSMRALRALGACVLLACVTACSSKRKASLPPPHTAPIDTLTQIEVKPAPRWTPPMGDSIQHEMRAVWLTVVWGLDWPHVKADTPDGVRRQQEELERMLDRLKEDGYNTIFFQARQSGSINYFADEPFSRVFTSSGERPSYDPLTFATTAAHKRGFKIHAWLVTYPLVSNKSNPHPLLIQHPAWAIPHKGSYHLDPGLPEVRTYIARLASDVARRYDVDGIHFDYFRYPEEADRYRDNVSYKTYGGGMSKAAWRRQNLTEQLREVRDSLSSISPDLALSVAPLGKLRLLESLGKPHGWTAYEFVHQDVETWAREGLVDFVAPMMYYKDHLYEPFLIDWQERVGPYIPVIAGLAPYRVDPSEKNAWQPEVIREQIEIARLHEVAGVSMFREQHIGPRLPEVRSYIQEQFAQQALYPALARGREFQPARPTDLKLTVTGRHLTLSWSMEARSPSPITYRVWATTHYHDGRKESYVLAEGLSEERCTMRLADFDEGDCLELGVEAVNRLGVSTPCHVGVEFNLLQDRRDASGR